jgi:hypothetical protein
MLLQEISQTAGLLPVGVVFLVLTAALFNYWDVFVRTLKTPKGDVLSSSNDLLSPQTIPSAIPWFGHVIGYVRNGHGYFSNLW